MKTRKFTKMLQYHYTDEEMNDLANALTDAVERVGTCEARKKAITSQATAELESAKSEQNVILGKRRSGYEYRDVECEEHYDFNTRHASVVRLDSGEIIETRSMTAKELQAELDLQPKRMTGDEVLDAIVEAATDTALPKSGFLVAMEEERRKKEKTEVSHGFTGPDGFLTDGEEGITE